MIEVHLDMLATGGPLGRRAWIHSLRRFCRRSLLRDLDGLSGRPTLVTLGLAWRRSSAPGDLCSRRSAANHSQMGAAPAQVEQVTFPRQDQV